MTPKHTGCHDLLPHLSDYLDGEAAADLCTRIEAHLAQCQNCRVVVDTLARTIRFYRDLPDPALPAGVAARLYAVLDLPAPK